MPALARQSPAKINLTLRVGLLWPDGFHELESLVARVGLCDTVGVTPRADGEFALECDDPSIPCDDTNLALRAARLLAEHTGTTEGARVSLGKRIPAGAGLGGGSSNAATTLRLLNELWQLGLRRHELAVLGAQIGSDVPLFFHGPLCVVRGRGEQVEDVKSVLQGWVVLVLPEIRCSTRDVYVAWDVCAKPPRRPTVQDVLQRAARATVGEAGEPRDISADVLMPLLFNDLEGPALSISPPLGELAEQLRHLSGDTMRMTGSGSAFFRLFVDCRAASAFAGHVSEATGLRVEVVRLAQP
jgi:4-diphosphocytidyl-2-C-methyl-D-erythritol kinase